MENLKGFPETKAAKLNSLENSILEEWWRFHRPTPQKLYHYTTAEGLIGILNSTSFWMTNLRYMNDLSELQYSVDLIENIIEAKISEFASNVILKEFFNRIRNTFSPFGGDAEVFAVCFCEQGNLLSQWRAYGGRGGGYAIGIDFFHLLRFLSKKCFLRKIIYEPAKQKEIIVSVIEKVCGLLREMTSGQDIKKADSDNTLPQFCMFLNHILGEYIFSFKHPEFSEEQEWRLVYVWDCNPILNRESNFNDLKFRTFGGNVIPYCEVSFNNAVKASRQDDYGLSFPVQELVIGPTLNPDFNSQSVASLLTKINPDHYPLIKKSGIPLRWL
ncbi:MAG: hypothetical protein A2042_05910 [Candidatus Schekmanbacteria bacterium GWA2_38_11]|uniref:DUF2971 domain-containing protein n=1 Tax=Candidatus Schekmanbacteria bacterium GWA2_38_11 TaxID=1817876 RepID=A0A1F7RMD1_9BACT|nr:MAG: hypothetical protein A2042_05910 [Candidatus Schekmanbacteria bacterium GWA2_38_11]